MAEGTIEKRGKHSWRVGVQVQAANGNWEWVRKSISFPSTMAETQQRREAEKALRRLMVDIDEGRIRVTQKQYTVSDLAALWLEQHIIPNTSANNRKTVQSFLDSRILPALGDVTLDQLTPLRLTMFINELRQSPRKPQRLPDDQLKLGHRRPSDLAKMTDNPDKTLSPRTLRHYYDTLCAMFDKAVRWDLRAANPMEKVDRPKAPKARANYLTEERALDLLRLLQNEKNISFRAAILLALLCGLRLGEVSALRLDDVDWERSTIDVTRALKYTPQEGTFEGAPKTDAGTRLISLPPGMMALLNEARKYQHDTAELIEDLWVGQGHIVHDWNGARLSYGTVSRWFRKFAEANGFSDITFHQLRHTHATLLLANNIDAVAVATRLGHADATTTLRTYAHALRRRDEDAAMAAQKLLDRL